MEVPSFMVKKVKRGGLAALNPCTNVQWMKAVIHCVHALLFFFFSHKHALFETKKSSYPRVLLSSEWSRRGSNPRPNNGNSSFLHAYFLINFRSEIGQEHPVSDLATEFS